MYGMQLELVLGWHVSDSESHLNFFGSNVMYGFLPNS
jgi:hypothetical protein